MANKRMFSKTITNSSRFLMMPASAQCLYFHLGMNADDDGFVEHFAIMRMTDSKPDDLRILQAKGFVKIFDEQVLLILDWKENNYIRSDRYTPSKYLKLYKKELEIITTTKSLPNGIPNINQSNNQTGDKMDTQIRLDKISIDKRSLFNKSSRPYKLAEYLLQKIRNNDNKFKQPKLQKWAQTMDKLIRLDKRSEEEIKVVVDFAITDSFWKSNILSADKLRKQFTTLLLQSKSKEKLYKPRPTKISEVAL